MKPYSKIIRQCSLFAVCGLLFLGMSACSDEKMEWKDPYTHPDYADIPLELQEKIARYEALNKYVNFKLGAGIDFNLYMKDEAYRNIINENFNDVTPGNEMKQSSVMNSGGVLNFSKIDDAIKQLRSAGLTIYGHTLVWHTQQQATYLNGLIAPTVIGNLITNGDFEDGTLKGWDGWGNNSTREISAQGAGYESKYAMVLTNPSVVAYYQAQAAFTFAAPLEKDRKYRVRAFVKSSIAGGSMHMQVQDPTDYSAQYSGNNVVGTAWTEITWNFTATKSTYTRFIFDFGEKAATYHVDNVVLMEDMGEPISNSTVIIEMPKEEKERIIKDAMEDWISKMVGHYKDEVSAWEVVNEPLNDNGTLRTSKGEELDADDFYWQDYLGKDYAVYAFQFARQYGNPGDKMFINDFNLESKNSTKLDGLIEYVKYIDSKGAQIDGIGTQMHLNLNWSDTTGIKNMFEKLGKTGKLIKITELDIAISSESTNGKNPATQISPTEEQYAQQADLYQYVVDMYMKYIPEAQRYGITVWGVSDNEKEHEYWLKNDAPCLWNSKYQRKHAYKGFADGLAGRDVSADFKQE